MTYTTKDSGERADMGNGGVRDTEKGKPRFDLVMPLNLPYEQQMLTRWASLMARGAEKYSSRNWELFNNQEALDRAKSSALRHMIQWINNETDEDHAAAVYFNIMAAEYVKHQIESQSDIDPWTSEEHKEVFEFLFCDHRVPNISRHLAHEEFCLFFNDNEQQIAMFEQLVIEYHPDYAWVLE